ncbi:MAG: hypothetical protein ACLGHQ_01710 [Acidimicrobiia bacterium]
MLRHRSIRIAVLAALAPIAACGDGSDTVESDANAFCGRAVEQRDMILSPPMANEAELEASIEFYRLMGQLAPVAIAEEWGDLVHAMETASTVVPGDPESEQLAAMTAYASEPSAFRVKDWLLDNCGLDLPITTIAPQEQVPARTTTLPAPPTSAPSEE